MNYSSENSRQLTERYMEMARQRLKIAKVALEMEDFRDSVSRAYYAMFDAATALLITKDLVPKSHIGAIRLLGLHFIKTGIVPDEFGRWFEKIQRARLGADYSHQWKFSKEETEEVYFWAEKFVNLAESLLENWKRRP
jgi:uncharacterized protein (UPF0332 family)